jgi:hypothetical protein
MQITIGKHAGETTEQVVLKKASYARWVMGQSSATGTLAAVRRDILKLVDVYDAKAIVKPCHKCAGEATRASAYQNNHVDLYVWCDTCDPYSAGANKGKLTTVKTYRDLLRHVEFSCGGTAKGYDAIIRSMAKAKGLPARVTQKAIDDFFG